MLKNSKRIYLNKGYTIIMFQGFYTIKSVNKIN